MKTRDPLIPITIKKHLVDKIRPGFTILNRLEGVSEFSILPKQGGEHTKDQSAKEPQKTVGISGETEMLKTMNKLKGREALDSKGKGKLIDDSDEEGPDEHELKRRKSREAEIDENNQIVREAKEKARVEHEAQLTLESRKLLFPLWNLERILNEMVDNPNIHWLEPVASFELENTLHLQLDVPITPKAFLFQSIEVIENTPPSHVNVDKSLMEFYLKHGKPQHLTWSAQKLTGVKVIGSLVTDSFVNVKLKKNRGSESSVFVFSLADLPCVRNPYDWITLMHLLIKEEKKHKLIVEHIKRMLVSYINEVAKLDTEIASVLKRKPTILPQGSAKDIEKLKMGKIDEENWIVMFHRGSKESVDFQKCLIPPQLTQRGGLLGYGLCLDWMGLSFAGLTE
ncbi:unnamed protein product [Lactuca saligna]|uniref:Uncharacterized protein n=1 Tax=Lactuca saligna TaxID=75948 RepID=A0AA35Z7I3_LACSI|nr:unnamed protein product [Lactuca saligna]